MPAYLYFYTLSYFNELEFDVYINFSFIYF